MNAPQRMLRLPEVLHRRGCSKSKHYADIKKQGASQSRPRSAQGVTRGLSPIWWPSSKQ